MTSHGCLDRCRNKKYDIIESRDNSGNSNSYKYCKQCEVYIKTDDTHCPCCRRTLRISAIQLRQNQNDDFKRRLDAGLIKY